MAGDFETIPDPAEARPVALHRVGGMTLDEAVEWFTARPYATATGGIAGMLAREIVRLRGEAHTPARES